MFQIFGKDMINEPLKQVNKINGSTGSFPRGNELVLFWFPVLTELLATIMLIHIITMHWNSY